MITGLNWKKEMNNQTIHSIYREILKFRSGVESCSAHQARGEVVYTILFDTRSNWAQEANLWG